MYIRIARWNRDVYTEKKLGLDDKETLICSDTYKMSDINTITHTAFGIS